MLHKTKIIHKFLVLNAYYYKLICLDFDALSDDLIDAGILNSKDLESTKIESCTLEAINASLQHGEDEMFDKFVCILRSSGCSVCSSLAKEMERKGTARIIVVHFLHFCITHQLTTSMSFLTKLVSATELVYCKIIMYVLYVYPSQGY